MGWAGKSMNNKQLYVANNADTNCSCQLAENTSGIRLAIATGTTLLRRVGGRWSQTKKVSKLIFWRVTKNKGRRQNRLQMGMRARRSFYLWAGR